MLHTVCLIHGLSIYEIKKICNRAHFFIISYGSFQHLANFLDITQVFKAILMIIFYQQEFCEP